MSPDLSSLTAANKRALLANLLAAPAEPLRRAPLSAGQLRLFQAEQVLGPSSTYNIALLYFLEGSLDPQLLIQALNTVVQAHASLRTSFDFDDEGKPFQQIATSATLRITIDDLSTFAENEWTAEVRKRAEAAARIPFNLAHAPLVHATLWRHSGEMFAFGLTVHHLVADRWSLSILAEQVSRVYEELINQADASPLKPPQFVDVMQREAEPAWRDECLRQLDYWQDRFPDGAKSLPWKLRRSEHVQHAWEGGRYVFELDPKFAADILAFSQCASTTPYVVLLAGFAVTVREHSQQDEFVVCIPVSGRHHRDSKGVIGYFNNLLPVRLDFSGDPTFAELVQRFHLAVRDAFDHQDPPFQQIASLPALQYARLTQCLFSLQNTPQLAFTLNAVRCTYEDVPTGASDFDIAMFVEPCAEGYVGILDYRLANFRAYDIERFAHRFQATFQHCLANPDVPVPDPLELRDFPEVPGRERLHPDQAADQSQLVVLATNPQPVLTEGSALSVVRENLEQTSPGSDSCQEANARGAIQPSDNELERRLIQLWEEAFGRRRISKSANFFDLGGNSLLAARLFQRMEAILGRQLPLSLLLEAPTVEQFVALVSQRGWSPSWSSLVPLNPDGPLPPLFLVHAGGGSVLAYRRLASHLGPDQPLWGIQSQGLNRAIQPTSNIVDTARHYVEIIRSVQTRGPYRLGGHSIGALIAYEMAQQLLASGERVALLVVLDHSGPAARPGWRTKLAWHLHCLRQLDFKDQLKYLRNRFGWKLRTMRGIPNWVRRLAAGRGKMPDGKTKSGWRLRMLESSMAALKSYHVLPIAARVTLIRSQRASPAVHADSSGGWSGVAQGGVETFEVRGDHMTMLDEPHVAVLASILRACLERLA